MSDAGPESTDFGQVDPTEKLFVLGAKLFGARPMGPDTGERDPTNRPMHVEAGELLPAAGELDLVSGALLPGAGERVVVAGDKLPIRGDKLRIEGEMLATQGDTLPERGAWLPQTGVMLPGAGELLAAVGAMDRNPRERPRVRGEKLTDADANRAVRGRGWAVAERSSGFSVRALQESRAPGAGPQERIEGRRVGLAPRLGMLRMLNVKVGLSRRHAARAGPSPLLLFWMTRGKAGLSALSAAGTCPSRGRTASELDHGTENDPGRMALGALTNRLAPCARLTIVARAGRPTQGPEIRPQSTLRRRG